MPRRRLLVTYDVRHPKRLRAVHKTMKAFGDPLQYSVFLCDLSEIERIRMIEQLSGRMNQAVDSIVIIDLGATDLARFQFLGTRQLEPPDGGPTIV
ncbi:CRISPR-associated endonuclease Cas2 [Streptomyces radicis]|uniref:CRISPR-associated endoribonuclease Cas2 n=1 Tax=Streptomyces radicis TaxID=1750517 RepID=A0A3A9W6K4_9ACTN|nr:CRISPR-associated endonuclease Cas2 [Streptomyces radicis]RKN03116.1 CRISPR-associated endonuclease Cas2 [Streptomyces radicis]RKN13041.1 CRISPR-associated endonuclease Cas2 [Streptomyces radicis]